MPSKGPDSNSCTLHLKVPNLNVVDRLAERPNIALNFQMVMLSMLCVLLLFRAMEQRTPDFVGMANISGVLASLTGLFV